MAAEIDHRDGVLYEVRITGPGGANIVMVGFAGEFIVKLPGLFTSGPISRAPKLELDCLDLTVRTSIVENPERIQYIPLGKIKLTIVGLAGSITVNMTDAIFHIEIGGPLLKQILDSKKVGGGEFEHHTARGARITCGLTHHAKGIDLLRRYGMLSHAGRGRNPHGAPLFVDYTAKVREQVSANPDRPRFAYGMAGSKAYPLIYMEGNNSKTVSFPLLIHTGDIKINGRSRKFDSFTKLAKLLRNCRSAFSDEFVLIIKNSACTVKLGITCDPRQKGKGTISITFRIHGIPRETRSVSIEHFVGVMARNASLSEESNKRNAIEWLGRTKCPHDDACPRNCVNFMRPNLMSAAGLLDSSALVRIPTPDYVKCTCGSNVSRYHYDIEIGSVKPKPLEGILKDFLDLYASRPKLFRHSKLGILLGFEEGLLHHINEYLFDPGRKSLSSI
jgi:hypothetical protein